MTIEKRKKKIINKVDGFLENRKNKNSSGNSSSQSHNQLIIDNQMNNITTIQQIPLKISIPPTKRTKRISYKQESHTATSSRYSHDSNWRTGQPDTITNPPLVTPIEIKSKLIDQQYSKKFQIIFKIEKIKTKK